MLDEVVDREGTLGWWGLFIMILGLLECRIGEEAFKLDRDVPDKAVSDACELLHSKSSVKLTSSVPLFEAFDVFATTDELAKTMAVAKESSENFMVMIYVKTKLKNDGLDSEL
jgi:hypothetical protein